MEQHADTRRFKRVKFNFVKYTALFCVLGIFLGAFTIHLLDLINSAFGKIEKDCVDALRLTWYFCLFGCVSVPLVFGFHLKRRKIHSNQLLKTQLALFNVVTFTFIQGALGVFSSDPDFLCYGTDGQNGMELMFNGFFALPALLVISLFFQTWGVIVEFS